MTQHRELTETELDLVSGGMLGLNPTPTVSPAEFCLELVKLGLTGCIGSLGNLGAPPKA